MGFSHESRPTLLLRREIEAAGAELTQVSHGERVQIAFTIAEPAVEAFIRRVEEAGHGQLRWTPPGS